MTGKERALGWIVSGVMALGLTMLAVPAEAQVVKKPSGPRTARMGQLSAGYRYGATLDDPLIDPWRNGLGVSLGYTIPEAVYFGTVFDYFFGESRGLGFEKGHAKMWQLSGELGYDVQLSKGVVIRPKAGMGVSVLTVDCESCIGAGTESEFGVAPGATAMFFPGKVLLSVDMRYQMIFAEPQVVEAVIVAFGVGF